MVTSLATEIPDIALIGHLPHASNELSLPASPFHDAHHQVRRIFSVACGAKCLQISRMVAPLLGSRDDVMDLEALPDVAAPSSTIVCVERLPSSPSEVGTTILAIITVSPQHCALHSDPDQATDQIRGAIGVWQLGGPLGKIPLAIRLLPAHLFQNLLHAAPFFAKALCGRTFEMTFLAERARHKMSGPCSICLIGFRLERANVQQCSVAEHQKPFLGATEDERALRLVSF